VRKSISIVGKKGVYCVEEPVDIYIIYEPTREHVLTFKGEIVGIYGPENAVDALPGEPPHVILRKMLENRLRFGDGAFYNSVDDWIAEIERINKCSFEDYVKDAVLIDIRVDEFIFPRGKRYFDEILVGLVKPYLREEQSQ